jgi:F-type H+-transporting ATPase subunit b
VGWLILDFAIFLYLVVHFGGPWLSKRLASRHDAVRAAMEEAAAAKAQAEEKARVFEERLRNLDTEIQAIRDDFRKGGEAVRESLSESGRLAAERIARDASLTIAAETERARVALKEEAARLALELAEGMVRDRLTDADRARFREEFIRELRS